MRVSWKDPPLPTMRRWTTSISELEHRVATLVRPFSLLMLRVSLGVVFVEQPVFGTRHWLALAATPVVHFCIG